MKRPATSLLAIPLLFTSLAGAVTHDCSHMRTGGKKFNFEDIGGPHSVSVIEHLNPSIRNTTWTVDICRPLKGKDKEGDNKGGDSCRSGTYVCGVAKVWNPDDEKNVITERVYEVAGSYVSTGLDPHYEILRDEDKVATGLELILRGGQVDKRKQQAVIEFQCDNHRTGNEGQIGSESRLRRQDDDDDDKPDDNNSLSFVSYGSDDEKKDVDTLRLKWRTKYACEDYEDDDDQGNGGKKGSWGFFTWLIVLLFLGTAAYLIFGSWLNYNRYGARGWDLLPHGDTIRDIPYLVKDWSRKVVDTVSGSGSRGGYSAV